jgi:hypothetical protein
MWVAKLEPSIVHANGGEYHDFHLTALADINSKHTDKHERLNECKVEAGEKIYGQMCIGGF